jgi:hypothetical protein
LTVVIAQPTSFMSPRLVLLLMIALVIMSHLTHAVAQSPSSTTDNSVTPSISPISPSPSPSPEKLIAAVLAREPGGEPVDFFTTETPDIYLRWQGQALPADTKIRCVWIAQNVGSAAPANYHVDEATTTANELQTAGIFTLSKPKAGWPEGEYRVEIYVGTRLVETLPFTIEKPRGD